MENINYVSNIDKNNDYEYTYTNFETLKQEIANTYN